VGGGVGVLVRVPPPVPCLVLDRGQMPSSLIAAVLSLGDAGLCDGERGIYGIGVDARGLGARVCLGKAALGGGDAPGPAVSGRLWLGVGAGVPLFDAAGFSLCLVRRDRCNCAAAPELWIGIHRISIRPVCVMRHVERTGMKSAALRCGVLSMRLDSTLPAICMGIETPISARISRQTLMHVHKHVRPYFSASSAQRALAHRQSRVQVFSGVRECSGSFRIVFGVNSALARGVYFLEYSICPRLHGRLANG
jgi:hypothetical protein